MRNTYYNLYLHRAKEAPTLKKLSETLKNRPALDTYSPIFSDTAENVAPLTIN